MKAVSCHKFVSISDWLFAEDIKPGHFSERALTTFIEEHLPGAVLVEDVGTEVCYQLPSEGAQGGAFERLFAALDANLTGMGISSYGISDTTLEEVSNGCSRV